MKEDNLIFLVPFAGGSAHSMMPLANVLNCFCTVKVLELPGRGRRINEPLVYDIDEITEDLFNKMVPCLGNVKRYYIFGHSMGALIGVKLVRRIIEANLTPPSHFFASGRGGPRRNYRRGTYLLPSAEFKETLKELGGSPIEVLENEDLMALFEPILRADFRAVETYQYGQPAELEIPITCFYGSNDDFSTEDVMLWQMETKVPIKAVEFKGNHFFIFEYLIDISRVIKNSMEISIENRS